MKKNRLDALIKKSQVTSVLAMCDMINMMKDEIIRLEYKNDTATTIINCLRKATLSRLEIIQELRKENEQLKAQIGENR